MRASTARHTRPASTSRDEIAALGPFEIVHDGDPQAGIPAVSWKLTDGEHGFNLFDLADRLRARGWLVPAYTLPPHLEELAIQRILVRHGFSRDMADLLLADMRRSLQTLEKHPPSVSLNEQEVGSFNHNATAAVRQAQRERRRRDATPARPSSADRPRGGRVAEGLCARGVLPRVIAAAMAPVSGQRLCERFGELALPGAEEGLGARRVQRPREQEALSAVALLVLQQVQLV